MITKDSEGRYKEEIILEEGEVMNRLRDLRHEQERLNSLIADANARLAKNSVLQAEIEALIKVQEDIP